jgi:hypothetical protein
VTRWARIARGLRDKLRSFTGGRVVVHVVEMPIKCPVAPLEFAFLADAYFRGRQMRDRVELVYVTPLPGAFTKPIASVPVDRHILLSTAHDNIFAVFRWMYWHLLLPGHPIPLPAHMSMAGKTTPEKKPEKLEVTCR